MSGLVEDELKGIPGAQDIKVEQVAGLPMVTIEVDRLAVARYGLNVKDVQEVIEISLAGANAGQVVQGDRRFELVVRLPENLRGNLLSLGSLPIPLPRAEAPPAHAAALSDGDKPSVGYVPLASVAAISIAEGARQIRREDGKRRIVVQCNVSVSDEALADAVAEARSRIEKRLGRLPEGYWIGWGGQFEHLLAARQRLAIVVPLALGLIGILLFATFGSIRQALLVFTGVPFALTGGVMALFVRDMPFSISAGVGFIALSGVAVLNGLVMVTFVNQLRREGIPLDAAVVQGAITRLRPVLMTGLVAALGFVPMAGNRGDRRGDQQHPADIGCPAGVVRLGRRLE